MAKLMIEPSEYDALIEIVEVLAEYVESPEEVIAIELGPDASAWFERIYYDGDNAETLFNG